MAFFGDPQSKGTKEDAVQCVAMALEMQRRMPKLRAKWRERGIDADLHIRMGINSGFTTVGNFGSNNRLDYTALGAEVNLASRLESNAKVDSIYISSATNLLIGDKFLTESVGEISVKGFSEPVSVFQVLGKRNAASQERRYSNLNIDGFSLYLDLDAMPNYNQKKAYEALVEAANKVKKFQDN
jgi:class 3 adenylate cyclase